MSSMFKVFVGNLPYSTTDEELSAHFSAAGAVKSARVITDKMTGRSRGFAFVEMGSPEETQAAIDMWDGKEFEGRTLKVNEARPMEERPRRNFGYRD